MDWGQPNLDSNLGFSTYWQETFGKSPYLSESQFPHLDHGGDDVFLGAVSVD